MWSSSGRGRAHAGGADPAPAHATARTGWRASPGSSTATSRARPCAPRRAPQIKDLNAQPFPDRAAIPIDQYLDTWRTHHGRGSVSLITARGCPYTCTWCSHTVFGETHRRQSPERTVEEVEGIIERYEPDQLWFADDVFNINHRWLFRMPS